MQLNKTAQGPICTIWLELEVEDDNGVCSLELRQMFTEICYNLSYRPLISYPYSLRARVRQGEFTGDVRLASSLSEKLQPQ
jgi:hypothetical protein